MIPWWCGGGVVVFLTDNNTSPTKVVLSCFELLVGLWQFRFRLQQQHSMTYQVMKEINSTPFIVIINIRKQVRPEEPGTILERNRILMLGRSRPRRRNVKVQNQSLKNLQQN
jgi:hypothetical protein